MSEPAEVKYPDIVVQLTGKDGNAFSVIGSVIIGLREAGVPISEIDEFIETAMSDDYDNVLRTCMSWVTVS